MTALEQFAGTWNLVSLKSRNDDEVFYPLGRDCKGVLFLDAAGTLAVQLMDPGRPNFESGDIRNGTDDEIKAAYQGFLTSWGPLQRGRNRRQAPLPGRGQPVPQLDRHRSRAIDRAGWRPPDLHHPQDLDARQADRERVDLGTGGLKATRMPVSGSPPARSVEHSSGPLAQPSRLSSGAISELGAVPPQTPDLRRLRSCRGVLTPIGRFHNQPRLPRMEASGCPSLHQAQVA